tara:strand:+ start:24591 stop:26012 length:1422 start_codon:yes stop_codon:yes gene_type:complete
MKNRNYIYSKIIVLSGLLFISTVSCEREFSEDVAFATFPDTGEIFTDLPIGMGSDFYFPYGGSKPTAWTVDGENSYKGSASMRFDVPNADDLEGGYAGAIFRIDGAGSGRDLSGFDALTFWAKASIAVTIAEVGFGEDFGENKYLTTLPNLDLTTNWIKYIIPIPDASKLIQERGMLRYAASGIGEAGLEVGYSFWIDELRFEKLGTIAQPQPAIINGEDVIEPGFVDSEINLYERGLTQTFNLASGVNQTVNITPSYFTFNSSDIEVARVSELGIVSILGNGNVTITAMIGGVKAAGSLTLEVGGDFEFAPTPTLPQSDVISLFSDTYTNVFVDNHNPYWEGSTTLGEETTISGQNIISYTELNYVATVVTTTTPVNASNMTHIHLDLLTPDAPANFIIKIKDFGDDGVDGGGDDLEIAYTVPSSQITTDEWAVLDIPLSNFSGLNNKSNIGFIIIESGINTIYIDNIYYHK